MTYRVATCVTTYNRKNYIEKFYNSWINTINSEYENFLIIADDGSRDGTIKFLENIKFKNFYLIKNYRAGLSKQTNSLFRAALNIKFDFGFKCDDDIWFLQPGWQNAYISASLSSGYDHLCYQNLKWKNPPREYVSNEILQSKNSVIDCMGCFWTFTPRVLKTVGFFDTKNFGFMGHEHIDYSMRCCRAGFNDKINFFDVKNSEKYINMFMKKTDYTPALKGAERKLVSIGVNERKRRWRMIFDENRLYVLK